MSELTHGEFDIRPLERQTVKLGGPMPKPLQSFVLTITSRAYFKAADLDTAIYIALNEDLSRTTCEPERTVTCENTGEELDL